MATESSISSNAFNFFNHIQNGVDPRTGLYTFRVELSAFNGSDLLAPEIDLYLRYSPLNPHDRGYGSGWSLPTSEFDPARGRRIISLANGETFKADGRVGGNQLTMSEKKIDTFHLYEDAENRWRVVHRSGMVEVLEPKGSGAQARAVATRIFSRQGHWLDLEYGLHAGFPMLTKITDMRGVTLLDVSRTGNRVGLTLPSDAGSATYNMILGTNNRVDRIELPTENLASWRFTYDRVRNVDCISTVRTPAGGLEEIAYGDGGHQFPIGSGLAPLPRVTQHIQHPGHGQPAIDTRYTYSSNGHNFLGGNVTLDWRDDGLDNLFRQAMDYDYTTTETLWVDDKPVRSTVREFNKFHLNTREAVYRGSRLNAEKTEVIGNNIEEKTITYDLRAGRFEEQVNACQLPVKMQTRWRVLDNSRQREEETTTTYDDYGNVLTQKAANGIVETSRWYRNGDDGYPGNAENFVCDLHTKTVTPAAGHPGGAPTVVTTCRYKAIKVLASSSEATRQENWCGLESETLTNGDSTLKVTTYDYHEQEGESPVPEKPLQHGRLKKRVVGFPNPAGDEPDQPPMLQTVVEYAYQFDTLEWSQMRDERLHDLASVGVFKTVVTTVGHDNTSLQTSEGHSLLSGELLQNIDEDQVERRTVLDKLRRPVYEIVAGGDDSEAVRSNEYVLCANEQDQAYQRFTSPTAVVTETRYDGLGREHQALASHVDPETPKRLFLVKELLHDARGREVEERQYDWLNAQPYPTHVQFLSQRYLYDSWEARNVVIRGDNVQEHVLFDPTEEDAHKNICKTTWLQVAQQTLKSEKFRTWSNTFEKPVRVERLSLDDSVEAEQTMTYDGLGQCVGKVDERKHKTAFEYDAFGRMIASVLPDDTRVEHCYAPHTDGEWATSITAISSAGSQPPFEVGRRCYNGVGKVTSLTIGKRTEGFEYDPGQSVPKARVTGAGDTINYQYNLPLSPFPTHHSVNQSETEFVYDPVTALMKESRGANGNRVYQYNVHDQLIGETLDTGEAQRTAGYVSTFYNRVKSRTDAGGMTVEHEYDERGRLESTREGNLQATFAYNDLGRLETVTSTDTGNGSTLITSLGYDDHGRECNRTQRLDQRAVRTLLQTWGKDNLLDNRVLRDGNVVVLMETFTYDPRGRLSIVEYSGSQLPEDEAKRKTRKQVFRYDSIDNIRNCLTTFEDGSTEMAAYTYKEDDRFLLETLTLTTSGTSQEVLTFSHDQNGNLTVDQRGRPLEYDEESRLLQVDGQNRYQYDGEGQILTSQAGSAPPRQLWFDENRLSLAIQDGRCTRFSFHADMPLAQQSESPARTLLLQTDASHSVIAECDAGEVRDIRYSAYGQRHTTVPLHSHLGFNGEALDEGSDWYMLGRGVRAYNPGLRRFNSPDPRSVFETGELNPYSYCLNNPIALRDPTGMTASGGGGRPRRPDEDDPNWLGRRGGGGGGWMTWMWVGIGVLATISAVITAGASLAAVGALGPAAAGAVSSAAATVAAGQSAGVVGFFLAKAAGTTIAGAILNTATAALAIAGTAAQTVAAISNDEQAGKWAQYLALASVSLGIANGVRSLGGAAWKAFSNRNAHSAGRTLGQMLKESGLSPRPTPNPKPSANAFRANARRHMVEHDRFLRGAPPGEPRRASVSF
ncbi:RHS repeat-associated core domain-containing protein [Pseudomonas sp. SAS7]|uniref:RHS repeat domain-containing protein n=1 Tax=Pseudomonas sp. SAS7 TaxID=3156487 RepID=UPI003F97C585